MDVLTKKNLFKIIWLPGENEILFEMKQEQPVSSKSNLYHIISMYINIEEWMSLYAQAYDSWLNKDNGNVYDICSPVNSMIMEALAQVNKRLEDSYIFYWFDIDRTFNEDFAWEFCPISGKRLIHLGAEFPNINALVSPEYPLVFPSN